VLPSVGPKSYHGRIKVLLLFSAERYIVNEQSVLVLATSSILWQGKDSDQTRKKRQQMISGEAMMGSESAVTGHVKDHDRVLWVYDWCQEPLGMRTTSLSVEMGNPNRKWKQKQTEV